MALVRCCLLPLVWGFKGWEYAWLEQVLGDGCGSREMILGYTLRLAGICGLCVVVVVSRRRSVGASAVTLARLLTYNVVLRTN